MMPKYSCVLLLAVAALVAAVRDEFDIREDKNALLRSGIADVRSLQQDVEAYRAAAEAVANNAFNFEHVWENLKGLRSEALNLEGGNSQQLKDVLKTVIAEIKSLPTTHNNHKEAAGRDAARLSGADSDLEFYADAMEDAISDVSGCDRGLDDYHEVDGTCFYVAPNADITWEDARADCQSRGMDLASILNAGQQATVVSLLTAHGVSHGGFFRYWIGGHQVGNNNNQWYWAHDASDLTAFSTYSNWSNGEPNSPGEMCAMMWTGNGWNDGHCHNPSNMRYFCQQF